MSNKVPEVQIPFVRTVKRILQVASASLVHVNGDFEVHLVESRAARQLYHEIFGSNREVQRGGINSGETARNGHRLNRAGDMYAGSAEGEGGCVH